LKLAFGQFSAVLIAPYVLFVRRLLRDNLDENGGGNQSLKRRPAAKV